MPSPSDRLYALTIVIGNVLAGTAMYALDNLVFAGFLCALGVVVAATACLPTGTHRPDVPSQG